MLGVTEDSRNYRTSN